MEQLLHKGSDISDLAYLRILQLVHFQTSALVEDLKSHELPHMSPRTPYEATEFRRSLAGSAPVTGPSTSAAISTMLETAMEELFVSYTEGQRYMERECKSLMFLYDMLLAKFSRFHVREIFLSFSRPFLINSCSHRKGKKDRKKPSRLCLIAW
jgi:exocyst complex component 5